MFFWRTVTNRLWSQERGAAVTNKYLKIWKQPWNWIKVEAGKVLKCVLRKVSTFIKGLLKMILVRTQKEKRRAEENRRPVKDAQLNK